MGRSPGFIARRCLIVLSAVSILCAAAPIAAQETPAVTREQLQSEIMRYILRYQGFIIQEFDDLIEKETDNKVRSLLQETKLANSIGITNIGLAPYAEVNLLDLIVFVTLTRMAYEDHWAPKVFGREKSLPLIKRARALEDEVWRVSRPYLSSDEQVELAKLIAEWRKKHKDIVYVEGIRFSSFADDFGNSAHARRGKGAFLFSAVSDATAELAQTRQLGERFLFFAQSLPFTFRETSRLMIYDMFGEPELIRLVRNSENATSQFARFNDIMEGMPEQIRLQVAVERDILLADLERREKTLRDLLAQTEASIKQGQTLVVESKELASLIDRTTDKIVPLIEGGDGDRDAIAEMQDMLRLATTTVRETDGLVGSVERLMASPQVSADGPTIIKVVDAAGREVEDLSDHLFMRLALLILFCGVVAVASALAYRYLALRMVQRSATKSAP